MKHSHQCLVKYLKWLTTRQEIDRCACCLTKAESPGSHVWKTDETLLIVFYISPLGVWISDKKLLLVFKYNGPDNMFRVLELYRLDLMPSLLQSSTRTKLDRQKKS